jgi:hypothetical protein
MEPNISCGKVLLAGAALRLLRHDRKAQPFRPPDDRDDNLLADALGGQKVMQIVYAGNRPVIKRDNHIAFQKSGFLRRAVVFERDYAIIRALLC